MNIDFVLLNEVSDCSDDYEETYLKIIQETCQQLDIKEDIEVSCILVNDQKIHEINKKYRHIDRPTDVISFALEDTAPLVVEGVPRCLGDIFISLERAKIQATQLGHSVKREMCFLFTHGLLHLFGFDHNDIEAKKEMFYIQDAILEALQIGRREL